MCPDRCRVLLFLTGAVLTEVGGTLLLRLSEGFTRPLPSAGVLVGYVVSILLFSRIVGRGISLGVAYGTLTGCGLAAATVLSVVVFSDPIAPVQAAGLALIAAGVLALQSRNPEEAR